MKTIKISLGSDKWMEFCGNAFYSDKKDGVLILTGVSEDGRGYVSVYVKSDSGKSAGITEPLSITEEYPCHDSINIGVNAYNEMAGFTGVRLEVVE